MLSMQRCPLRAAPKPLLMAKMAHQYTSYEGLGLQAAKFAVVITASGAACDSNPRMHTRYRQIRAVQDMLPEREPLIHHALNLLTPVMMLRCRIMALARSSLSCHRTVTVTPTWRVTEIFSASVCDGPITGAGLAEVSSHQVQYI